MLFAVLFSMAFSGHKKRRREPAKGWSVAMACLAGLVIPALFGFLPFGGEGGGAFISNGGTPGSTALNGIGIGDLSVGDRLLVLMDTDCASCRDAIGKINELAADGDLPEVIALAPNDEKRRVEFMETNIVEFYLAGIGEDDFWRLLGAGDIPRTMLVRDGRIIKAWDREAPGREAVLEAMPALDNDP